MAIVNRKATFSATIEEVWDTVVSLEKYAWRSDVDRIEVKEDKKQFVEYAENGFATTFYITAFEPCKRYEFDLENENIKGHWTGLFSTEKGKTTVEFTENVIAKKLIMKPFTKGYLKREQVAYITSLRRELGE